MPRAQLQPQPKHSPARLKHMAYEADIFDNMVGVFVRAPAIIDGRRSAKRTDFGLDLAAAMKYAGTQAGALVYCWSDKHSAGMLLETKDHDTWLARRAESLRRLFA
jgi:hypothetical protein